MNKLFKFFLTSAAISAALVGAVSCQKDFAPDIESLNKKVAELTQKLTDLQTKIDAGEVVTNVTTTAGGITVTTNKGTYNIVNGKDGTNGTNGTNGKDGKDGSVVTIENGNWFIDGKDTGLAAAGKDGKNGEYYVPNPETGCFDKYTWDAEKGEYVKEATTISFVAPGTITAVWDKENNQLVFKGIEGKDPYTISLLAEVKSLVFMPNTYIDGVEALVFDNFHYWPKVIKKDTKDTKKEQAMIQQKKVKDKDGNDIMVDVDSVDVQPAILAQYHVNPTNADLSFLKEGTSDFLSFIVVPNAKKVETKAEASEDFAVTPIFKSFENGVLTVEVNVEGYPATDELLSVMALNIEKADGEFVTSDYAMLQKNELDDLVIAFKNSYAKENLDTLDAHLRRALEPQGISVKDELAYVSKYEAWTVGEMTMDEARKTCDVSVKFDSSLDLKAIVAAHTVKGANDTNDSELVAADLERLGLTWDFEVVKNYKIGTEIDPSLTDQAEFVTLEDGVFTPKVFSTSGIASVGRTPIIRVALKHGDDVVAYAYIKVFISNRDKEEFDAEYVFDDSFGFVCLTEDSLLTTVKYMNEKIYNEIGMPAKEFHGLYDAFMDSLDVKVTKDGKEVPAENVGTVEDIVNSESQGTHILKWKISAEDAWKYAGKEIYHFVAYYKEGKEDLRAVFWNADKTATRYNVAVPSFDKDSIPEHCVFVNEINYSFETWRSDDEEVKKKGATVGLIKLAPYITKVDYFFCATDGHDIKAPKINDKKVEFKIVEKDTVLLAKLEKAAAYDTIAVINNHPEKLLNTITLNKRSDLAKALLNTKQLYVNIGAKGYACSDATKVVTITFNGQDHFRADYVRPINISNIAADKYIDGVSYGEKGSYIRIEDLISPADWRTELDQTKWIEGAEYGKNRQFKNYPNFWKYYGPFEVEVDLENVKCDLNGRVAAIPAYLQLARVSYEDMAKVITDAEAYKKLAKTDFGYITYKNNGQVITTAFNLFMNVTVKYGWGFITVEGVKVPVSTTIEE